MLRPHAWFSREVQIQGLVLHLVWVFLFVLFCFKVLTLYVNKGRMDFAKLENHCLWAKGAEGPLPCRVETSALALRATQDGEGPEEAPGGRQEQTERVFAGNGAEGFTYF